MILGTFSLTPRPSLPFRVRDNYLDFGPKFYVIWGIQNQNKKIRGTFA